RAAIHDLDDRYNFADVEQSVYDLAILFESTFTGDLEKAFDLSEESRCRTLLAQLQGSRAQISSAAKTNLPAISPLQLKEIRSRMPDGIEVVEYSLLDTKLLTWVVSKERFDSVVTDIDEKHLGQEIREFVDLLGRPVREDELDRLNDLSKELYGLLFMPVERMLDGKQLII